MTVPTAAPGSLPRRQLGRSGIEVCALGLGAGPLGDARVSDAQARDLVHAALDLGIDFFDTAPSYGSSEARLGEALHGRSAVVSTKLGYGVPGVPDWTGPCITAGVALACERLQREVLDVAHLHSCPREILERGEVIEALVRAREAGRIRAAAYSGENEALDVAIATDAFDIVQASVSPCDPDAAQRRLPQAKRAGLGVIAKRPLANAPWRFDEPPSQEDFRAYHGRFVALGLPEPAQTWSSAFLRFALFDPVVDVAIAGTRSIAHLRENASAAAAGPDLTGRRHVEEAWARVGADAWPGII